MVLPDLCCLGGRGIQLEDPRLARLIAKAQGAGIEACAENENLVKTSVKGLFKDCVDIFRAGDHVFIDALGRHLPDEKPSEIGQAEKKPQNGRQKQGRNVVVTLVADILLEERQGP